MGLLGGPEDSLVGGSQDSPWETEQIRVTLETYTVHVPGPLFVYEVWVGGAAPLGVGIWYLSTCSRLATALLMKQLRPGGKLQGYR